MNKAYDIIGIGAPVLDTLVQVEDSFLEQHVSGAKGGMEMVDAETMDAILSNVDSTPVNTPGGSAGNTIFALSRLGLKTAFLGKLGNDSAAEVFRNEYQTMGGDTGCFKQADAPNARCLCLVTPDSERTMRTMLGASALLTPDEISPSDFSKSRHVHIEGYLLFNPDLIKAVAQSAKEAGCTISLDLASFEVVNASKSQLSDLLSNEVDIVFANEDEAKAYFPDIEDYETIAKEFAKVCEIAVVKLGADGSLVAQGDTVHRIPGNKVERAIDTTGAGDLWASGFLAGWLTGKDLPTCGAFGSLMGAEIVQIMGASIPENRWSEILKQIQ